LHDHFPVGIPSQPSSKAVIITKERSLMEIDKLAVNAKGQLSCKIRCVHTDRLLSGKMKPASLKMQP
jgi:hypothetical protein